MSRCFPYTDTSRNEGTNEALIKSIKLQKKREEAKRAKKEKKRTEKANMNGIDQLERSDITQEHGHPVDGSHKPSNSSDSTQSINKRKWDDVAAAPMDSNFHGQGKTIKIRLLKKHHIPDSSKETSCSNQCGAEESTKTSGYNYFLQGHERMPLVSSFVTPNTAIERLCLSESPTRFEKKMKKKHLKYEKLIGRFAPPPVLDDDDEGWLFRKSKKDKKFKEEVQMMCRHESASWLPCARFLPNADVCALPYVFPF